ncbi:unnamed protein product [Peronospora belbahrii]|uniref:RNA polymerase II-associated protein 1 C-terminal domain-containing protein n=1 Tax=Peronospora belbahrii TaxID=622444 RepID=A0ABN8D2K6_9STRA|nr:unnamed protein product [Peronospora belbahrii]
MDMDAEFAQLLREQDAFLAQKKPSCAKVTSRGSNGAISASHNSKLACNETNQVLKHVVERQVTHESQEKLIIHLESLGFPLVKRRDPGQRRFGRRRHELASQTQEKEEKKSLDQEKSTLNAVNTVTLEDMSPQEIQEAQEELLRTLGPELIEKLKSRRKKKEERCGEKIETKKIVQSGSLVINDTRKEEEEEEKDQLQKEDNIKNLAAVKTEEELKQQVNLLPEEERAKLDWTQSTKEKKNYDQDRSTKMTRPAVQAATLERFDLDGKVLKATDAELPMHSGLFHHGDDPDVAGYTLPELLHLARSSVASQRAMSLKVVAKILHNRQLQANASLPVVPRVLPRDLAITLRLVLDDQNYTAIGHGVSALHAFIVPVEAECFSHEKDYLTELKHGTIVLPPKVHIHQNDVTSQAKGKGHYMYEAEEVVYIDTTESDDGSSISDEDLAALDPVQAFLKLDLGTRLWYILETIRLPDQCAIEKMLEILIAVARHSPRAAHEISSNARLIKTLQQYIENEQVLTFQEDNARWLRLSLKALQFVRALCQGKRSIASAFVKSGLIQSTKGFLALNEIPTGTDNEESSALFAEMQIESLRIWRILLGYGLDFHCFAYLFPVLSGFTQNTADASVSRKSALFAVLEAFCGLEALHEAQHYFNQLNFFLDAAKDEAIRVIHSSSWLNDVKAVVLLSTVLRFIAAASAHVTKYNLETSGLTEVLQLVQSREMTRKVLPQLSDGAAKRELLLAIVHVHRQIVANGLLSDDMDDEEVVQTFSRVIKAPLLAAATSAAASSSSRFSLALIQACELTCLLGNLIDAGQNGIPNVDAEFVQKVYRLALINVERVGGGGEYLVARLFAGVLFHQRVLLALVNTSHEQEAHSAQVFTSSTTKFSYHLRLPQEEQTFVPSSLPLPNFWMVCPLSRIDYSKSGDGKPPSSVGPTRAQSDEMKLIVSATCRFLFEFERLVPQMSSISAIATLRPEDKLFHLLHAFFAGSDVLFDDHVDAALRQLLPKLVQPLLRSPEDSRVFYEGILRNLKRVRSLEFGMATEPPLSQNGVSYSSDEQQVLTFVEKLVGEFTASSFGNPHFAHCVTLLMTRDFSLEVRQYVWKELQESHLLHTLAPFEGCSSKLFMRCIRRTTTLAVDSKLLQLMQQARETRILLALRVSFLRRHFSQKRLQ